MIKKTTFYILIIIFCLASYSWIIINLIDLNKNELSLSVCALKNITGIPCASCGTTRAILYFFKGNFLTAIYYNPIGLIVAVLLIILPIVLAYDFISEKFILYKKHKTFKLTTLFWILLLATFSITWLWNLYKYFMNLDF